MSDLVAGPPVEEWEKYLNEKHADWVKYTRDSVVAAAVSEIGDQQRGSPQVYEYWRETLPESWSDERVKQYAATRHWCGGFALWCLKQAGIARDVFWKDGVGFVYPAGLTITSDPKPGDIAYTDKPFQHYAVVGELRDGMLTTIDGNQPDVRRKTRQLPTGITFFSITPLLVKAVG